MKVIEVVQFDTHLIEGKSFNILTKNLPSESYGPRVRNIDEKKEPTIGFCWYISGKGGIVELYKSNYDTGD